MTKLQFLAKVIVIAALISFSACSQPVTRQTSDAGSEIQPKLMLPVWPGVVPGSENWTQQESEAIQGRTLFIYNVSKPTITVYLPEPSKATGTGIIVAPGGGFTGLAIENEGRTVAQWLAQRGIAAFLLKYRVANFTTRDMNETSKYGVADGIQALKIVREHSSEWGISPERVGFMGFSAGAMVAAMALVQSDPNLRPNFAAPIYGGIFGTMPKIPSDLPPTFLAWAQDDTTAGRAVVRFYDALKAAGNKPELHIFNKGGHGFGMLKKGTTSDHWIDMFYYWIEANGWNKRAQ